MAQKRGDGPIGSLPKPQVITAIESVRCASTFSRPAPSVSYALT